MYSRNKAILSPTQLCLDTMVNSLKYLMELYHCLVKQNLQLSILLDQLISLDTDMVLKL